MDSSDTRLRDVSQALLDNLASELANRGITVPTRQYITAGDVAADLGEECDEALIVSWVGMSQGVIGVGANPRIQCAVPTVGQFNIFLLRCVPTLDEEGRAPSAVDLQASGEAISTDAMTLVASFVDLYLGGALTDTCAGASILNMLPVGPLGGISGTAITVSIGLV